MEIFREQLKVNRKLVLLFGGMTVGCVVLYVMLSEYFVIGIWLGLFFTVFNLFLQLRTNIYDDRIEYQLFLFHLKPRVIEFKDMASIKLEPYDVVGVSGFKVKTNWNGALYYFGGKEILRVLLKNGKTVMLSTFKGDELKVVIENMSLGRLKDENRKDS